MVLVAVSLTPFKFIYSKLIVHVEATVMSLYFSYIISVLYISVYNTYITCYLLTRYLSCRFSHSNLQYMYYLLFINTLFEL